MIVTRNIINPNIKFHDFVKSPSDGYVLKTYSFAELSRLIDGYKNLLVSRGAAPGDRVVIGEKSGPRQVAAVFACCELGLDLAIVNKAKNSIRKYDYSDEVLILKPRFLITFKGEFYSPKIQNLKEICELVVPIEDQLDYTENTLVQARPDSNFLSCIIKDGSIITHNHEFIHSLSLIHI